MGLENVVRCAIHPGIGIARIGNSPTGFFIGPEVPGQPPTPDDGLFKDASGRIKRQVARFRIYGFDRKGHVVKELTADDADITWTVHLANRKAAWYSFQTALDIPGAQPTGRRNPTYPGDRSNLVIDTGPRSISGRTALVKFDRGTFLGVEVPLGEIRTDAAGRLLVFGGMGQSASVMNQPIGASFDNPGWYDDVSDGPVSAQVQLGGQSLEVVPAWVIVAPPDYTPGIWSAVTMYDIVYEVATKKWLPPPSQVSFTEHIYPIFRRFSKLQWVNEGFYLDYGWGSPDDLLDSANIEKLSSNSPEYQSLRERIFLKFRDPDYVETQPDALPPLYGDGMSWPPDEQNPRNWLTLTRLQYDWLQHWSIGNFQSDWNPAHSAPQKLEDFPLSVRPRALDEAALENCVGGAFHPGCEATWPMRHLSLYSGPFRIKHRAANQQAKDYGDTLTPQVALSNDGPLSSSGPGDITCWMSVPWQIDTASCGAGYQPNINPYFPTFWPARVPNHVLTEKSLNMAMDKSLNDTQRLKYFGLRQDWLRDFTILLDYLQRVNQFAQDWSKVGIVVRRESPPGHPLLPQEVHVEVQNELEEKPDDRFLMIDPRRHR